MRPGQGHGRDKGQEDCLHTRILWRIVALMACLAMGQMMMAAPIFVDQFDAANFVFDNDGGLGFVDTGSAPTIVALYGHDFNPEGEEQNPYPENIITSFLVTVTSNATFEFYWGYLTTDDGPSYDPFGYYLNGSFFQLTDDAGDILQTGFESVVLQPGDVFGFYIDSTDGCCGGSLGIISGDPIEGEVPEPATGLLAAAGLGVAALMRRRR
jgi:uncharacterized protein (TIGR03382 family)